MIHIQLRINFSAEFYNKRWSIKESRANVASGMQGNHEACCARKGDPPEWSTFRSACGDHSVEAKRPYCQLQNIKWHVDCLSPLDPESVFFKHLPWVHDTSRYIHSLLYNDPGFHGSTWLICLYRNKIKEIQFIQFHPGKVSRIVALAFPCYSYSKDLFANVGWNAPSWLMMQRVGGNSSVCLSNLTDYL